MRRLTIICVLVIAALAGTQNAWSATVARHTKERAERNLLGATRMLARWHVGLTDPRSGLLLRNTTASCVGVGRPVGGAYPSFACTLRHGIRVVHVRYFAQAHGGFEVRRLA